MTQSIETPRQNSDAVMIPMQTQAPVAQLSVRQCLRCMSHCQHETRHFLRDKQANVVAVLTFLLASTLAAWGTTCIADPKIIESYCGDSPGSAGAALEVVAVIAYGVALLSFNSKYKCIRC